MEESHVCLLEISTFAFLVIYIGICFLGFNFLLVQLYCYNLWSDCSIVCLISECTTVLSHSKTKNKVIHRAIDGDQMVSLYIKFNALVVNVNIDWLFFLLKPILIFLGNQNIDNSYVINVKDPFFSLQSRKKNLDIIFLFTLWDAYGNTLFILATAESFLLLPR